VTKVAQSNRLCRSTGVDRFLGGSLIMRLFAISLCLFLIPSAPFAQSVPTTQLGNWSSVYPGAVYVSPQDSSLKAPGIYRSLSRATRLTSPIEITQICIRDFRETKTLNSLYSGTSEAAGLTDVVHKNFGAKLAGLNLKYVKLGANVEIKDEASFTATPLTIWSADDDISSVVLANIGESCKTIILSHLRQGRAVFIAGKAIQAKNFEVSLNAGPKAGASISCSIPILCSDDTGISGDIDRIRQLKRSAVQPVTFAIVPAEISGARRELREADLR
jgi:hypothetical protein